jgi:outer membrane protein
MGRQQKLGSGFNILLCPSFNGWSTQTNVQRAKIQEDLAEINAIEARNVLRQTIETAYNDAQAAAKVYEAAQKQVDALEESFRATEKSYNLGAVNFVDYQVASFNLVLCTLKPGSFQIRLYFQTQSIRLLLRKPINTLNTNGKEEEIK